MNPVPGLDGRTCPLPCVLKHLHLHCPPLRIANKPIVWVLCGPGSGKGTQCDRIVAKYGFCHLSTGELQRDSVQSGSARGKIVQKLMLYGKLVPNEIVLDLLKEANQARFARAHGFLIDGYPREKSQGIEFERTIGPVTVILYFEASSETLTKRVMGRSLTSGRVDDNEQTIKVRMQTFLDNDEKVLKQYPNKLRRINAEQTICAIFTEAQKVLDPIVAITSKRPAIKI